MSATSQRARARAIVACRDTQPPPVISPSLGAHVAADTGVIVERAEELGHLQSADREQDRAAALVEVKVPELMDVLDLVAPRLLADDP